MNLSSLILLRSISIRMSWSKEPKHLEISPSIYQVATPKVVNICLRAVWQLILALNPWLLGEKLDSYIASSNILMTSWTILSLGGATVSGLFPPEALGIWTLLPGLNLKVSFLRLFIMSWITSSEKPSKVVGTIPGVMFPGLLFNLK